MTSVLVRPPSHRRMRLGMALRRAREALPGEVTQGMAAQATGMSQSQVNRLENAQVARVRMDHLERLIEYYRVPSPLAEQMRTFARTPYAETGVFMEAAPDVAWWTRHLEVERLARVIEAVHLQAHDGLTQCVPYMRRQFALGDPAGVEARVQARLARQRAILDQPSPPKMTFVLAEACLHTTMGDALVMRAQIRHLLELMERPHLTVLVRPFAAPVPTTAFGWSYLGFGGAMRDFVSVQFGVGAATVDDDAALREFRSQWDQARSAALSEDDTRKLMLRVLGESR